MGARGGGGKRRRCEMKSKENYPLHERLFCYFFFCLEAFFPCVKLNPPPPLSTDTTAL